MPKQGKTPKKKSKEKTPQKSGESEYPAMDQEELNRLVQNAIEQSQAQLQQKHEEQIKRRLLEADREALEERLTRKFEDEVRELNRAFDESRWTEHCIQFNTSIWVDRSIHNRGQSCIS